MTPLTFNTIEEAREYFLNRVLTTLVEDLYQAWLSDEKVIIKDNK